MYRIAYAILADREEAADAVQDALLKLWCSRSVLDTVDSLPFISISLCAMRLWI